MLTELLLASSVATFLLVIFLLIKSLIVESHQKQHRDHTLTQLVTLEKTYQTIETHTKEHLLVMFGNLQQNLFDRLSQTRIEQNQQSSDLREQLQTAFGEHRMRFDERQLEALKILQDTLNQGVEQNRQQLKEALNENSKNLGERVNSLTQTTEAKLKEINEAVEKRLLEGFEKTNETFNDVIKRLALIDAAQKKITELSTSVVSLQDLLNDKRSRGAFGEVQLSGLIHNMIPDQYFSFQHLLSNHKRPDCMLFLPEPTGNIAIDAKFPLENYRQLTNTALTEAQKQSAERQFKIDIKKHIQDIAEKYIIPGETSDGAVMFIPAEAVFAEIHAHHTDLVEFAQRSKIWLVSPTTMMAILTTARAVLKDAATRKQVHEIQKHLRYLAEDFERFQLRMENLAKRIAQAHHDVDQIHTSARKITHRFTQIEKAEMDELQEIEKEPTLLEPVEATNS